MANGKTETRTVAEQIKKLRKDQADISTQIGVKQAELKTLTEAGLDESNPVVVNYNDEIAGLEDKVSRLDDRIEAYERDERTRGLVEPLIKAFGSVSVDNGDNVSGNITLADLGARIESENNAIARAKDRLAVFNKLSTAAEKSSLSEEDFADMRPFKFVVNEDGKASLEVVSSRGGGRGGSRMGSRNPMRIVEAPEASHVGKIIGGEDGDFKSFTTLAEEAHNVGVISDDEWVSLTTTKDGNKRSVSFKKVMQERFGYVVEAVEASE